MGLDFIDKDTQGHFIMGIISTSCVLPKQPLISFTISNLGHLVIELSEHKYHPNGNQLESDSNHYGDIIFFFFGSIIGLFLTDFVKKHKTIRYILLLITIQTFILEIGREIFPYTFPINPAFE